MNTLEAMKIYMDALEKPELDNDVRKLYEGEMIRCFKIHWDDVGDIRLRFGKYIEKQYGDYDK
jgi:hypothetical protein